MNKLNFCSLCSTFIFRKQWNKTFLSLSDEDAGKLIKQILRHTNGEEVTFPDDLLRIGDIIIADIEGNCYKYLMRHKPQRLIKAVPTEEEEPASDCGEIINTL